MVSGPTFESAKAYKMLFGKFKGQALDDIAKENRGLLYLDWLAGQAWVENPAKMFIVAYVTDPGIATEIVKVAAREFNDN